MKVVAVVPMKLNNERLPNKNTKLFSNGKPLCSYIFDTLTHVKGLDEIYVYCSDEKIKQYMPNEIIFLKRDKSLDRNITTMNDVLKSFANKIDADIYILTHATAPFLSVRSFEECIKEINNGNCDSAFTVRRVQDFLWKDFKPINYDLKDIPRTQDLPLIYKETCGFYMFKKEVLEKNNKRIGEKPYLYEVSELEAIDINNAFDFKVADCLLNEFEEKIYEK